MQPVLVRVGEGGRGVQEEELLVITVVIVFVEEERRDGGVGGGGGTRTRFCFCCCWPRCWPTADMAGEEVQELNLQVQPASNSVRNHQDPDCRLQHKTNTEWKAAQPQLLEKSCY